MKNKMTVPKITSMKSTDKKLAMITAYDCPSAKLVDEAGADIILVGDSLGMVVLGYENTLSVTMEDMLHHAKAVTRCAKSPLVVGDLPFMSYQVSVKQAVGNAGRFLQEGKVDAVKLEGGQIHADKVKAIVDTGIPVMGHIGLTPQHVNVYGGFKVQGKTIADAEKLIEDAYALENAGVFSIVLEAIPEELADIVTRNVSVPTIGIGAGRHCDGQVLVFHDLLSIPEKCYFKFSREFANAGLVIQTGLKGFVDAVKDSSFPDKDNVTHLSETVLTALLKKGGNYKCM